MNISNSMLEAFEACCLAHGVEITPGRGGITVAGKKMDARAIFLHPTTEEESTGLVISDNNSFVNCELKGYATDRYKESKANSLLLVA